MAEVRLSDARDVLELQRELSEIGADIWIEKNTVDRLDYTERPPPSTANEDAYNRAQIGPTPGSI